jgi:hypothetical protein
VGCGSQLDEAQAAFEAAAVARVEAEEKMAAHVAAAAEGQQLAEDRCASEAHCSASQYPRAWSVPLHMHSDLLEMRKGFGWAMSSRGRFAAPAQSL